MVATQELRAESLFSVKDHVCLVSGGGTGIGLMAAQSLAANGAKVYITGRRMEVLKQAAEAHASNDTGEIIPLGPFDVTSKGDLEKLYEEILSREKRLDLLVANAGISGPKAEPDSSHAPELKNKLFGGESFEEWSDVFNTNVSAVYFTTVALLPLLQAGIEAHGHHSASVIVISSMSGIMRHAQGHFSYNSAKGATIQLVKLMSFEFQNTGVRINSIAPGYFPSEMTTGKTDESQKSELSHDYVKSKGYVSAQRPGSDEEMAQAVLFLAKNRYVNGGIIAVDGGALLNVAS